MALWPLESTFYHVALDLPCYTRELLFFYLRVPYGRPIRLPWRHDRNCLWALEISQYRTAAIEKGTRVCVIVGNEHSSDDTVAPLFSLSKSFRSLSLSPISFEALSNNKMARQTVTTALLFSLRRRGLVIGVIRWPFRRDHFSKDFLSSRQTEGGVGSRYYCNVILLLQCRVLVPYDMGDPK